MTTATVTSIRRRESQTSGPRRRRLCRRGGVERMQPVAAALERQIIGQDAAIQPLVSSFSRAVAGLNDPDRPLLTVLLLGPTGVGKTETARTLAESLFGDANAMTRVNCEEYSNGHELGKLFGAPPGYVGHEVEPLLSQERIDSHHLRQRQAASSPVGRGGSKDRGAADELFGSDGDPVSVVLFDEIEKAHPKVWSALLGALESGTISLGDNESTSFRRSILVLTSNVGSDALAELLQEDSIGFSSEGREEREPVSPERIRGAALEAARQAFPPEFLNRMDLQLVFDPLERDDLDRILDRFVNDLHKRILERTEVPMLIRLSRAARDWILDRGTDPSLGARPLRRAVESQLVDPLAAHLMDGQIEAGDVLEVDVEDGDLAFFLLERQAIGVVA